MHAIAAGSWEQNIARPPYGKRDCSNNYRYLVFFSSPLISRAPRPRQAVPFRRQVFYNRTDRESFRGSLIIVAASSSGEFHAWTWNIYIEEYTSDHFIRFDLRYLRCILSVMVNLINKRDCLFYIRLRNQYLQLKLLIEALYENSVSMKFYSLTS